MAKLDFEHFCVPLGVSGKHERQGDARESFADVVYMAATGVRAHRLAFKIYESNGPVDYSDDEVGMIIFIAENHCTPSFIDGLKKQIDNQNKEA